MDERELIRKYFALAKPGSQQAIVGPGDDAAVLAVDSSTQSLSTDMLIGGVHFDAQCDPFLLGRKALAASLSDLAAMGARPQWALLSLALPTVDEAWLERFAAGWHEISAEYKVFLAGGDLAGSPNNICISVTVGGTPVANPLRLNGAKPGDALWASGVIGAAAADFAAHAGLGSDAKSRLLNPIPRVELGCELAQLGISAATDLSDGLLPTAQLMADSAGLALHISWDQVLLADPVAMLNSFDRQLELGACWGEDYELLFAAHPDLFDQIKQAAAAAQVEAYPIGTFSDGSGVTVSDFGRPLDLPAKSTWFSHIGKSTLALAAQISKHACDASIMVAAAESCTAGQVAASLGHYPGSSEFFAGGVVAYSAQAKVDLLDVPTSLIKEHGIVSKPVACSMAAGAAKRFGTQAAVATTGWAGPSAGDGQQIGTVCIAAQNGCEQAAAVLQLAGGREQIKNQATIAALRLLDETLTKDEA